MQPGGIVLDLAVDYCIEHALDVKDEQHGKDLRPMVTKAVLVSVKDRWKNVRSAHRTAMKKRGKKKRCGIIASQKIHNTRTLNPR